jgi:predicted SnoaL-like aldol condensation-catalyzing enzyme
MPAPRYLAGRESCRISAQFSAHGEPMSATAHAQATRTSRKDVATSFLRVAATADAHDAFDRFVSSEFRHHNPYFRGDAPTLAAAMAENAQQNPEKVFDIEHALEDGDLVAVHSRVRMSPGAQEHAVVHLFRFVGDRIVELWDIGQAVPADSPNENGMF